MSKVMVSLPEDLLAAIDAESARRSVSRSALLAQAARREIEQPQPARIADAVERSRARFGSAPFESARLVRADRDRDESS